MKKRLWSLAAMMTVIAGCTTYVPPKSPNTAIVAGTWTGPYDGQDSGTITFVSDTQGNATCSLRSASDGHGATLPGSVFLTRDMLSFYGENTIDAKVPERYRASFNEALSKTTAFNVICANIGWGGDQSQINGSYNGNLPPLPGQPAA